MVMLKELRRRKSDEGKNYLELTQSTVSECAKKGENKFAVVR